MFERERKIYAFLLDYAQQLVADIPDDRMAHQPAPGINPPAWQLGHLVFAADGVVRLITGETRLDEAWLAKFGLGSTPSSDPAAYPSKAELLEKLVAGHERAAAAAATADPTALDEPHTLPVPSLRRALPTRADLVTHLLTSHEASHIGHLSSWRRQMGLPYLF